MNLWIRSQDRAKLIKVEELILRDDNTIFRNAPAFDKLGTYKTKERALEVLDEIQVCLSMPSRNNLTSEQADLILKSYMISKVYDMPKE